jgi:hypothetical protein
LSDYSSISKGIEVSAKISAMLILKLCIGHTSAGDSDRLQAVEDDVLLSETAGTSGGGYEDQPPAYGSVRGTKSKFGRSIC